MTAARLLGLVFWALLIEMDAVLAVTMAPLLVGRAIFYQIP